MKKALVLGLVLHVIIPYSYQDVYKCPDTKLKMEDICAIGSTPADNNENEIYYLYIKDKCSKDKVCTYIEQEPFYSVNKRRRKFDLNGNPEDYYEDYYYTCQKNIDLSYLKIDQKCSIDAECYTGYCKNGKCSTLDVCLDDEQCKPEQYCALKVDGEKTSGKCENLKKKGDSCTQEDKCQRGLICDYDYSTSPLKGKCQKYFTKSVGDKVSDPNLCKSGYAKFDNVNLAYICLEFDSAAECKDDGSGDYYCEITSKDKDGKQQKDLEYCPQSNKDPKKHLCPKGKTYFKVQKKAIEQYDKIDLEKFNEKEIKSFEDYFGDKKYAEYASILENFAELYDQKIIDDEGEMNKDFKCEYNFLLKQLSSNSIKVCFVFIIGLLGLLLL